MGVKFALGFFLFQIFISFIAVSLVLIYTDIEFSKNRFITNGESNEGSDMWILVGGLKSNEVTFRVRKPSNVKEDEIVFFVASKSNENATKNEIIYKDLLDSYVECVSNDFTRSITVSNLQPNKAYTYGFIYNEISGNHDDDIVTYGSIRTPAMEGNRFNFTVAVAGCALTGSNTKVFRHVISHENLDSSSSIDMSSEPPLMFLHLGDFHYEDLSTVEMEERIEAIDAVMKSSAQRFMFANTALTYMWDDHDWLGDNSLSGIGDKSAERDTALLSYQIAFPHYDPLPSIEDNVNDLSCSVEPVANPTYHAFTIGTVRFIVTDLRSESTLTHIYSDEQREWFFNELSNSDAFDYVVWLNTKPWIGPIDDDGDSWRGYPDDRQTLSDHINDVVTKGNLLVVSADAHMVAFDDGRNTYYGRDLDTTNNETSTGNDNQKYTSFPLLHSGPLDKLGSIKGGPFSHGCHTVKLERNHQYSTISFEFPDDSEVISDDQSDLCILIQSYSVRDYPIWNEEKLLLSERICGSLFDYPKLTLSQEKEGNEEISNTLLHSGASCSTQYFSSISSLLLSISVLLFVLVIGVLYRIRKISASNGSKKINEATVPMLSFILAFIVTVLSSAGPMFIFNIKSVEPTITFLILSIQCFCSLIFVTCWWYKLPKKPDTNSEDDLNQVDEETMLDAVTGLDERKL